VLELLFKPHNLQNRIYVTKGCLFSDGSLFLKPATVIDLFDNIMDFIKKFNPYILGGAIGSVIHRMRTEMSLTAFLKSVVMSIFISTCVGIACKDYLMIKNENLIFMACGLSGAFSKLILDEIEQILKLASVYVKVKLGITKKEE
jgi:hypothetical protein